VNWQEKHTPWADRQVPAIQPTEDSLSKQLTVRDELRTRNRDKRYALYE